MEKIQYQFEYIKYSSLDELDETRKNLVKKSIEIAKKAHVPYSNFHVGAAVLLENGEILVGNNQENASYPVGTCAERTLLNYVHANFPEQKKLILAVSVLDTDQDVSPCGMCRQAILEYENLQNENIEIILHNNSGSLIHIPSAQSILPLNFNSKMLNQ
ncbi:cytidine deaminase [Moheibacter stercoris]|uniref:Cytidine deaminase n=1 Tax=Moheibacter stercoris TaxID=1628251 RepID=A0ABV2LSP8_9FLAO